MMNFNDKWVDRNPFYGKVKFGPLDFEWKKWKKVTFSVTLVLFDMKMQSI